MPVNDEPVVDTTTTVDRWLARSREVIGADTRTPARTIVLYVAMGACMSMARPPFNIIGTACIALLALSRRSQ